MLSMYRKAGEDMNYLVLSEARQDLRPWQRLLQLLPERESLQFLCNGNGASLLECNDQSAPVTLIVTHPFWVQQALATKTAHLIVLLVEEPVSQHTAESSICYDHLLDAADLICTRSERTYLDLVFRRENLLLVVEEESSIAGAESVAEELYFLRHHESLFLHWMKQLLQASPSPHELLRRQWQSRVSAYQQLLLAHGHQTPLFFMLGVYQYLLGVPEAREGILASFEQSVLHGDSEALSQQFRFLSAIEAKMGQLPDAIQSYGVSCVSLSERQSYQQVLDFYNQGAHDVAKAALFLLNDDFAEAARLLTFTTTPEAKRMRFRALLLGGRLQEALALYQVHELTNRQDRLQYRLLQGRFDFLHGKRHAACHSVLQAAAIDPSKLLHLLELQSLDRRLHEWIQGGLPDDVVTDSQTSGQ